MVVFEGTALDTMLTPFTRFDLLQYDFHNVYNSFRMARIDLYMILFRITRIRGCG